MEMDTGLKGVAGEIRELFSTPASTSASIPAQSPSQSTPFGSTPPSSPGCSAPKSRVTAALLAIFLGILGVHKFYMGSWGWGIVFFVASFFTGIGIVATVLCGIVEGTLYFTMTDEVFAAKYPPATQAPFRW